MADDYKLTVTMRVTVEDRAALLATAGDAVPAAAREDEDLAARLASIFSVTADLPVRHGA